MRLARTWVVFGICLAVVLAAMGWISLTVLQLERAQVEAQQRAVLEENVRLALWRMDSALAPVIAQETARPHFAYTAFYPAEKAYTPVARKGKRVGVTVPSPLLTQKSDFVLLYFQFEADGTLSSPQAPTGRMRKLALEGYITEKELSVPVARLAKLRDLVTREDLLASLPKEEAPVRVALNLSDEIRTALNLADATDQNRSRADNRVDGQPAPPPGEQSVLSQFSQGLYDQYEAQTQQQIVKGQIERMARNDSIYNAPNTYQGNNPIIAQKRMKEAIVIPSGYGEGVMVPLWVGDILLLARRVSVTERKFIQGCWLDWKATKAWMFDLVRDLLPDADLEPVRSSPDEGDERMLAALPVRLVPGPVPIQSIPWMSPVRLSLLVSWACVLLGAGAVGLLLYGTISLSERRGAFVSAVTHELRTPLTTFRMYSEMLERGMVKEEEKRREYLKTLCTESERLSHLVENVLSYARLEKRRTIGRIEHVTIGELIERLRDHLAQRAEQAGMEVVVDADESSLSRTVRTDVSVVDQILFNLVDNACKYAASASDRRIHIDARFSNGTASVTVRDHGPGIAGGNARRLFRPFSKSASDAADSAPGVGLGLALSRRLARSMGGDLRLHESGGDGACFVLTLLLS